MTRDELRTIYPYASEDFLRANASVGSKNARNNSSGLRSIDPKPDERVPLGGSSEGEETCWHNAARRFEIVFTIYSRRPADWDGWDIKALQDFCVQAGIIPDDGWKTLSGRIVSEKVATEAEEKTVITITCA